MLKAAGSSLSGNALDAGCLMFQRRPASESKRRRQCQVLLHKGERSKKGRSSRTKRLDKSCIFPKF